MVNLILINLSGFIITINFYWLHSSLLQLLKSLFWYFILRICICLRDVKGSSVIWETLWTALTWVVRLLCRYSLIDWSLDWQKMLRHFLQTLLTLVSSGVKGEVRQWAAVHAVVRVCGVEAPQKITDMSEMETSVSHGIRICNKIRRDACEGLNSIFHKVHDEGKAFLVAVLRFMKEDMRYKIKTVRVRESIRETSRTGVKNPWCYAFEKFENVSCNPPWSIFSHNLIDQLISQGLGK